jgi:hypothetical protein
MANHKARRPRARRAGCKLCKPWKRNRATAHKLRDKRMDERKDE